MLLHSDISSNPRACRRLRTACERAKRVLSSAAIASIEIESLFENLDFYTCITRSHFEKLCEDLIHKSLEPVEKVLRDSKFDKARLDDIVLIGGSTRIPGIVKAVSDFFDGRMPNKGVNPDEIVAYGAAINAAMLTRVSHKMLDFFVLDVVPFSLG